MKRLTEQGMDSVGSRGGGGGRSVLPNNGTVYIATFVCSTHDD
jgi:hypothetical protein